MNKHNRRRGSAIAIAMLCLFIVFTLGMAISALTLSQVTQARRVRYTTTAFNLAEAGADQAVRWFKDQASPPSNTSSFDVLGGTKNLGDGTYQVTALPDSANPGSVLKMYTLTATGSVKGITQQVEVVIRQSSFGKYAYFTDAEVSAISGGAIWFYSGDHIRGPAHSNNSGNSSFQVNWGADSDPIFLGPVTSAASSITYTPKNPSKESDFLQIYATGSKGYQLNVDPIPMPSTNDGQKAAAWGSATGYPSTTGVYVKSGGGVYIAGDADITMTAGSGHTQVFTIVQTSTVKGKKTTTTNTVTYDLTAQTVSLAINGKANTTVNGMGSGVVYCTGDVTSLSGTIADNIVTGGAVAQKNSFTIATDVAAGNTINVTDNIKYKTPVDTTKASNDPSNLACGTLGLVGKDVIVDSTAPTSLEIDGVIMAGSSTTSNGSFYVENYDSKAKGTLKVVGGIIQKARGPVGTLSGSSLSTGYAKDYYYDARMADDPPPFFPTTGGYDRLSWRRITG